MQKVAIIGAGITGISSALELSKKNYVSADYLNSRKTHVHP